MQIAEQISALEKIAKQTLTQEDMNFIQKMRENPDNQKIVDDYISGQYKNNKPMQQALFKGIFIGSLIVVASLMKGVESE